MAMSICNTVLDLLTLCVSTFYVQQFKSFILEGAVLGVHLLEDPQIWSKQLSHKQLLHYEFQHSC